MTVCRYVEMTATRLKGIIPKTISEQLRRELPGLRGFSEESIKKMRTFAEFWSMYIKRLSKKRQSLFFMPQVFPVLKNGQHSQVLIKSPVLPFLRVEFYNNGQKRRF